MELTNTINTNTAMGFAPKYIKHRETGYFSKMVVDFVEQHENIRPFINGYFTKETVPQKIENRKKQFGIDRVKLAQILTEQYDGIVISTDTKNNLEALKDDNTFTITTAHQLNLFTGPLYYFYKIIHCINLCEDLSKTYPEYNFVPVFWINTEDHDFEEVNHFHLYGKTFTWETEQSGAVGNFSTDSLSTVIEELEGVLGTSENAVNILEQFRSHYLSHKSYRKAVLSFVNSLFKEYGLVIVDQQNAALKSLMFPFLENELTKHELYANLLETRPKLEAAGYHEQALPRAINLFYIDADNNRNRIVYENEKYTVLNTTLEFSETEILTELRKNPIRFSTNVLSRPVYQQTVLPNLAYIGGGGELAYWMQLKQAFTKLDVYFPDLILRNSVLIADGKSQKKLGKLDLSIDSLFTKKDRLIKSFVKDNSESELSLADEKTQLEAVFQSVMSKALKIDQTLEKSAMGEMKKQLNSLEKLEAKILRAEKRNFENVTNKINAVQDKLFPNGKLQERYDNFLTFWVEYGNDFVPLLKNSLDPWQESFTVLLEE